MCALRLRGVGYLYKTQDPVPPFSLCDDHLQEVSSFNHLGSLTVTDGRYWKGDYVANCKIHGSFREPEALVALS